MEVRRNGSGLSWEGCSNIQVSSTCDSLYDSCDSLYDSCSNIQDTVCPVADKELVEHTVCDNPDEDCKVRSGHSYS